MHHDPAKPERSNAVTAGNQIHQQCQLILSVLLLPAWARLRPSSARFAATPAIAPHAGAGHQHPPKPDARTTETTPASNPPTSKGKPTSTRSRLNQAGFFAPERLVIDQCPAPPKTDSGEPDHLRQAAGAPLETPSPLHQSQPVG